MLKNYLKTSLRSLWKNKGFSAINIIGLAAGLATCLLIILYVLDELSFDKYNTKAARIYRVNNEVKFGDNHFDLALAPALQGPTIVQELPQAEQFTRFRYHSSLSIKKGNENLRESNVTYADSTLLDVFSFQLVSGNPKTILNEPQTLLITESMAKKYFNRTDVAGESLLINNNKNYKITGVIKNIPSQSHFNYDFFVAMTDDKDSRDESGWLSENYNTYIVLKEGADPAKLVPELDKMMYRKVGPILKNAMNLSTDDFVKQGGYIKNSLTPLTDIHLRSNKMGEMGANGSITYVYIFSAIAAFILLIACVNFMNLSTAKSANRAREVGVRKVLGSLRKNLVSQFLVESLLVSFISLLLALLVAAVLLPLFNNLAAKQIPSSLLFQPFMMICAVLLVFIVGLLAGSYPAFFLSAFKPIEVLKGRLSGGFRRSWLRNTLVVFQFAVSIILIAGTLVVYNQLQYIRNKDIGFNKDKLLTINNISALNTQANAFKNELLGISGISNATITSYLPVNGNRNSNAFFSTPAMDQKGTVIMQEWIVDENYLPTLGIQVLNGRNLSPDFPTDSNAVLINEAAAKALATKDLLNKKLYQFGSADLKKIDERHIIGVIKNFNFSSLRDMITPMALELGKDGGSITLRMNSTDIPNVLTQIKNKWKAMAPAEPFVYSFMDEEFNNQYLTEQQTGKIFVTFAVLAIFIACLGLFGLAAYAAEQRTKEIGIRKVLGASVSNIAGMLSKDFLKLVLIASVIAFPVAWWAMHKWLQDFAYRVNIGWSVFFVSGMIALFIALFTVAFQAIKAAMANPVKSLRTE
jgi:putative ABC transport system permease protein